MEFLNDTNIVVLIAFLIFIGVLLYLGVPKLLTKLLDERAEKIRSEIDEARSLREEAQTILASYERKQQEVKAQADAIISQAREEAKAAAAQAQVDLAASVERRVAAAEAQIASTEASVIKDVKNQAVSVAMAAAQSVIAQNMSSKDGGDLIDAAITEVGEKLH